MKNCGLRIADCGFGKATILLLIFPLLYFTNNLKAQTAYHGGMQCLPLLCILMKTEILIQ